MGLETALVRTIFENRKHINKLRRIPPEAFIDPLARDFARKMTSGVYISRQEVEDMGSEVLKEDEIQPCVEEVLKQHYLRQVTEYKRHLEQALYSGDADTVQKALHNVPRNTQTAGFEHISEIGHDVVQMAVDAKSGQGQMSVPIPFVDWHMAWGGISRSSVHIVGADPGGGKSAALEQLDLGIVKPGSVHKAGVMSMEMPREKKLARYAQHLYGPTVGPRAINNGTADLKLLKQALEDLTQFGIYVNDKRYDRYGLVDAMYEMHSTLGISYFTVDFLQLMTKIKGESKYDATSRDIDAIYGFSKDTGVPTIIISQLNREGRKLQERPRMTDLEGAGTIEQVAYSVNMLWMPDPTVTKGKKTIEWFIPKNREGEAPATMGKYEFNGPTMNFNFT